MGQAADTIVAAATPPGTGGIAIVRVSGDRVEAIAECMLGQVPRPRVATFRPIRDKAGARLDNGIALYFPAPDSFTGEPVLELHGHGSPVAIAAIVEAAIGLGARLAEPGEFTQRAFLNDKLDLAQAEAIADLIASGTQQAARAALQTLSGAFSSAVNALAEQLVQLRTHVEAAIDFPEEEIDFLDDAVLLASIADCGRAFDRLLENARVGRVLRDGYRVVIVGKPNAGKSSLLNRLSGEDSAIVTEVAGTTRDILREQINIDGLAVELIDTAGLRDNPDRIEEEGIRRARQALASADAVLWIQDANEPAETTIDEAIPDGAELIIVRNKLDETGDASGYADGALFLSARTGEGIGALHDRLRHAAGYRNLGEGAFTARQRHVDALRRAAAHFDVGRKALQESGSGELLAEELRLAHQALGEITGAVTSDELLGRIFSEFCIGK
jgi:tRNA modification GTPase